MISAFTKGLRIAVSFDTVQACDNSKLNFVT
jgi:hypothetical protein